MQKRSPIPSDTALSLRKKRSSFDYPDTGAQSTSDPIRLQNLFYQPPVGSKEFKRLKFKNMVYMVGDVILVDNMADPNNYFVAKITKIRSFQISDNRYIVGCLVQWFYRKSDLKLSKYKHLLSHVSENEVFPTNHEDAILTDSIRGICSVVSLQDYEDSEELRAKSNCFFTRASFDVKTTTLDPPVESWSRYCTCQRPVNPDIPVIQCESCEEWFHFGCVGLSAQQAEKIESYYCRQCSSSLKEKEDLSTDA